MILLRLITWPYLRTHVLRSVLTAGGIALGVAVFVGMNSANESVLLAFSRTVDRIAGKTELQVSVARRLSGACHHGPIGLGPRGGSEKTDSGGESEGRKPSVHAAGP